MKKQEAISKRIGRELELPSLLNKLTNETSPSDLSSLLTEIFACRTGNETPANLLKQYSINRYAKPADCNAAEHRKLEAEMLCAAEDYGIKSIILSPASLLGCCSVFGGVSQNKIISGTRNLEILSDATNMLTLYITQGLKNEELSHNGSPIHICTTHRHLRYQTHLPTGMLPHFGLFTMVSSGQSASSYSFEIESLLFHLKFYLKYWNGKYSLPLSIELNPRRGYKDTDGFINRIYEVLNGTFDNTEIKIDKTENTTNYYQGVRVTMNLTINGQKIEIGDLGFTDWTQKLLNRKSERLLISAMSLDRQMNLAKHFLL